MCIEHTNVDISGRIISSVFSGTGLKVSIDVNCLEVYLNNDRNLSKNKIARLLESLRTEKINSTSFESEYSSIKEQFIQNFIQGVDFFENRFYFYCFRSNNVLINKVLNDLKDAIEIEIKSRSMEYVDISSCLIKKKGSSASKQLTFKQVLDSYDFYPDVIKKLSSNDINNVLDKLLIIDDTIAEGKALYALLKQLNDNHLILNSSKIKLNCIYCMARQITNSTLKNIIEDLG